MSESQQDYKVILYYKYADVKDPEELRQQQWEICQDLNLKGRILIANEGINGTLEGTSGDIKKYCQDLKKRFPDIHIKSSQGTGTSFPKLSIRVRPEIVSLHLGEDDFNPNEATGQYITVEELHEWFENEKEFYIIDMRNDYELKVGKFERTVFPGMKNFRDLPKKIEEIKHLKDKTVVTVCTGGIRCEKASGLLLKHGFKNVYQLYGGIHTYMEKYPNQHFKGKLYVFDQRIVMGFNTNSSRHEVIGQCDRCGKKSENYVNCGNDACHKHFICCQNCFMGGIPYCSDNCLRITAN